MSEIIENIKVRRVRDSRNCPRIDPCRLCAFDRQSKECIKSGKDCVDGEFHYKKEKEK